ncbi:MAG: nucleotidyltransferase family protein [Flavobacteriales bacterium]
MPAIGNRTELMQVLQGNATAIRDFGVLKLGVFGSFARDTATPQSDVDLFVEFGTEKKTLKNLLGLSRYLENLLGRKVELITPGSLNPFIGKYILEEVQYVALAA